GPGSRQVRGPGGPSDRYRDVPRRLQGLRPGTQHRVRDPPGRPCHLPPWRSGTRAPGGRPRADRRRGHRARAHLRRRRQPHRRQGRGDHPPARAEGRRADVVRPGRQEGHARPIRSAATRARRERVDAGSQTVGGTAPRAANEGFARGLVIALAGSIPLYVIGFWSGSFVARAALSTPVFVAIIVLLGWSIREGRRIGLGRLSTPQLSTIAGLTSL